MAYDKKLLSARRAESWSAIARRMRTSWRRAPPGHLCKGAAYPRHRLASFLRSAIQVLRAALEQGSDPEKVDRVAAGNAT